MSNDLLTLAWRVPLPAGAKFVLVALADAANDEGVCWPSRDTLARMTGLSKSSVSEHLRALKSAGLVEQSRRRHEAALYTVVREAMTEVQEVQIPDVQNQDVLISDLQNPDVQNPDDPESGLKTSRIRTSPPYTNHQEPISAIETANASTKRRKSKRADEYTDAFEAWWMVYPRKKDKFAAFRAFQAANKKTSTDVLMAAARSYAAEVAGRADEHIKLGGTWLTKRCWESDEATPVVRTEDEATEWVRQQWRAADVAAVESATSLTYDIPDLPLDVVDRAEVDAFFREHRQKWITDNHATIISRLTRGIA